jgi:preprotein translocase subunit SecG
MKAKRAILLALFFVVITVGMTFAARARQNQVRAQEEQARAAALQAMQEHHRMARDKQQQQQQQEK